MPEVLSISTVWLNRAREAEDAARELDRLSAAARFVLANNYFGTDCVEGAALYGQLAQLTEAWSSDVAVLGQQLGIAAANCRHAAAAYVGTDQLLVSPSEG